MNMLLQAAAHGDLRDLSAVMAALDAHAIVSISDSSGVIEYVNDKFCQVSGYAREELLGRTHRIVNSGTHAKDFFPEMWRTISAGRIWRGEIRNRKKSGEFYWVETTIMPVIDGHGFPARYVSIRTEITELRRLEERSERQRLLLEIVHAGTTQFVASSDLRHAAGFILKGLLELTNSEFGFTGAVVAGEQGPSFELHAVSDIGWDEETRRFQEAALPGRAPPAGLNALCQKVIEAGRAAVGGNSGEGIGTELPPPFKTFIGVPVFFGTELVGLYGLANRPGGYDLATASFLDPFNTTYGVMIHAHRMAQREHAALAESLASREEAERANRAKSDFLSSMSHELRTPLNVMVGFSQLLSLQDSSPAQRTSVQEIVKAGEHLQTLIDNVLDLAKIESGHLSLSLETVGLHEELEQIVRLMRPMAEKRGISLSLKEVAPGIALRADRVRLRQSVLNLLSNAIKYTREGGAVSIAGLTCAEGKVRVLVSDTGVGISLERQAELFIPFHRLVEVESGIEGTGIGLAITRRLVEAMGGTVGVESRPGLGSTFWVELPASELAKPLPIAGLTQGEERNRAANPPVPGKARTILYIEDNPANLRLIEQLIERRPGLTMLSAHEPRLGIQLVSAHLPDVILLDVNLPEIDGYELLERLKANPETAGIPVIAVTANAMQRDIERGRRAGFHAYLTKPLDVKLFYATLDGALETLDRAPR